MNLNERKMAAFESGAQAISMDYCVVSEHFDSLYLVNRLSRVILLTLNLDVISKNSFVVIDCNFGRALEVAY